MEEYVPKVIIEGKWGSGPGEFGIHAPKVITFGSVVIDVDRKGSVSMDVDRKGDIFIYDPINWRVVVYNKDGKYKLSINIERDPKEVIGNKGFKGGYARVEYEGGGDIIKVDSDENIYIQTGDVPYMQKFDKNEKLIIVYVKDYLSPKNIISDLEEDIYESGLKSP